MRRILLPTDFSDNSLNAIKYAINLYRNVECEFYVLHTNYNFNFIFYRALGGMYIENSQKNLHAFIAKIENEFENPKHHFEPISSYKLLYHEVVNLIGTKQIELIVMGSNGATGGEELLFGSHTVQTMRVATRPLLAIPSHQTYSAPNHMLFATKYEIDFEEYQIGLLKRIAARQRSKVHFLYADFGNGLNREQEKAQKKLTRFFADIPHQFHSIEKPSVAEAIDAFQQNQPIGLLVMIKHRHSFIERLLYNSVTNEIGLNNRFPFLVLPAENYNVPKPEKTK